MALLTINRRIMLTLAGGAAGLASGAGVGSRAAAQAIPSAAGNATHYRFQVGERHHQRSAISRPVGQSHGSAL